MINRTYVAGVRGLLYPVAAALALASAGCTFTDLGSSTGNIEYKSAQKLPSLDVPPDLIAPRGEDRYAIPERQTRESTYSGFQASRSAPQPVGEARVLPTVEGMRIERAGTQRWLVVSQPADRLWPVLREFWQESGFVIQTEAPAAGLMETDWAENRAKIPQDIIRRTVGRIFEQLYSTGERDKFRTRLESVDGGTEVYISHRGMVEVAVGGGTPMEKDSTVWQPRPSDPELEAEFLRRLMLKLGADQQKAQAMMAASAQPGAPAARIVATASQGSGLEIRESFDRAWRRVGLALDRGGFTVEDRDRSQGTYFVRYIDPESAAAAKKDGFFSRLFSGGQSAKPSEQYRVVLVAQGDLTRVSVATRDGKPLESDLDRKTGEKILALLREQMLQ